MLLSGPEAEKPIGDKIVIPCHTFDADRYEWWTGDKKIPGEISSTLVISNISYNDVGQYRCVAFDTDGNDTSSSIQLNVRGQYTRDTK